MSDLEEAKRLLGEIQDNAKYHNENSYCSGKERIEAIEQSATDALSKLENVEDRKRPVPVSAGRLIAMEEEPKEPEKCPECGGPLYLTCGGGFPGIGVDVCRDCGYHPATYSTEEQTEEPKEGATCPNCNFYHHSGCHPLNCHNCGALMEVE